MTLRLTHTAKTYPDGTKALLPIELSVGKGEIVSLLGLSGYGKTTLLWVIVRLDPSDAGSYIWFDDDNATALPVERRQVGMVFQAFAGHALTALSGEQHQRVALAGAIAPRPRLGRSSMFLLSPKL